MLVGEGRAGKTSTMRALLSELRRNKYEQIEAVRAAGLDAPLQALAKSSAEVEAWLGSADFPSPFKAVERRAWFSSPLSVHSMIRRTQRR